MSSYFILHLFTAILIGSTLSTNFAQAASVDSIIEGCEGEGCGCADGPKANQDFTIYEKMELGSKVLGKFKAGTDAKAGKAFTKVVKKGKSKVIEVRDSAIGLKIHDEVNTVFYLGEGFYKVKLGEKWIEYKHNQVKLKQIEAPKYELWFEIKMGKLHGYSPIFPFMGCLA